VFRFTPNEGIKIKAFSVVITRKRSKIRYKLIEVAYGLSIGTRIVE